jgi:hypothetical protein
MKRTPNNLSNPILIKSQEVFDLSEPEEGKKRKKKKEKPKRKEK